MTKAVFFDWFNTLAQYYPPREEIHANACREVGIEVAEGKLNRGLLLADQFYIDENARSPIKKRSPQEQIEVYAQYECTVLKEAGVEISDEMALRIMQKLGGAFSKFDFVLFDDVLPTFELLKQRGLVLGLISNIDRDIMPFCQELGLASYLDFVVTSQEVGSEKPHPPIFLAALERAGVKASEAMYVGDHYGTDVVGAREIGMEGVLLDRYDLFQEVTDCPRIKTLAEVVGHL